jgi:predicted membrane-bound spermidine synthase
VVAVLVAFMGGLALGNAWLGVWADRVRRPLALYAWLEIGIGLYALVFPWYYELLHQSYLFLARGLSPGGTAAFALKFAFGLLTILIPTVLMGGTLPVLTRLVTRTLGELRERVANLYFVNSVGAVAGCFLADFWWIPAIGLEATVWAGAAMNLGVGVLAFAVNTRLGEAVDAAPSAPQEAVEDEERYTVVEWRLAVIGAGVSGFAAMLYEVIWTRMLGLALGSSTHAFAIMLITFITGIAAGAWCVMRWRKLRRTLDAFGWAELALAGTLAISMLLYDLVPYWFARMAGLLARQSSAYAWYGVAQGVVCFAVMFIPTLCLGLTLPLATRVATHDVSRTGRSVGAVFAVNTLGTVLGAALTGLCLLPWLGLARTFALGIVLNAWLGLIIVMRHRVIRRPAPAVVGGVASVGVALLIGGLFDSTWHKAFTLALWRVDPPADLAGFRAVLDAYELRYYRDGAGSSVSVEAFLSGGKSNLALRVNGKPDASTGEDMPTQMLAAHIPMLLHPDPKDVLIVGLGSGVTAGSALQHPEIQQVDVVEISPEVVEGARLFADFNHRALEDPRCRVVVDDAKAFLQMTDRRYDIIISEPSNPWLAGVSAVFSREYYEQCRLRLKPGGIMAQWVQIYETDDSILRLVLNTFASTFPQASIWQTASVDLLLVSTIEPVEIDLDQLERRFAVPVLKADLERIDLFRPVSLLARELIPAGDVQHLTEPGGRVHSDFYPILEYAAQRAFFARQRAGLHERLDHNQFPRPATLLGRHLQRHPLAEPDLRALALFHFSYRLPDARLFRSILYGWQAAHPQAVDPAEFLMRTAAAGSHALREIQGLIGLQDEILRRGGTNSQVLRNYADLLYQAYRDCRSAYYVPPAAGLEAALERVEAIDPERRATCRLIRAEVAWDRGDDAGCLDLAQPILEQLPAKDPTTAPDPAVAATVLTRIIDTLARQQRYDEAWPWCTLAERAGFLESPISPRYPALALACRKVLAGRSSVADEAGAPATSP